MTRIARTIAATPLSLVIAMASIAGSAAAQTQLFEVERSDATKLLQVQDDAGLVVKGAINVGSIPAEGGGVRLMWYPKRGAFRAGGVGGSEWDDASIGYYSVAFGENTKATNHSVAMGERTTASGFISTAMGHQTMASGQASTAMGAFAVASGDYSTAMGLSTTAVGPAAVAIGDQTTAAGLTSVALGFHVSAGDGSFIFGDRSSTEVQAAGENQFVVRAYGGTGFNSAPNVGCDLPPGSAAWACTSSRLAKEGFEDVDGEGVLAKLAGIRIQSWRYIGTAAVHMGPTAEDFRAAFGLGEGSTKIAAVDADGIALRAAQALERRTAALQAENAGLRADLADLRAELTALRDGLHASADAQP